jgi:DeoR/GlpR family transcriptional regulator of sugar metabolism
MLTSQRKKLLLAALKRDGQLVAKPLSVQFGVSEDTIRRDLRELAQDGLLQRVHGGALPASSAAADFSVRRNIEPDAKSAIAKAAAQMIKPGQVVILDGGTTCVQVARQLPRDLTATVVTHSPSVAVELAEHPTVDVIVIGGRLFKHSIVAVGAAALEALSVIRADLYFMGVTGVHRSAGLSTGDLEEAYVKRALMKQAAETVVLASSEKINAASAYKIADIGVASSIIVEKTTPLKLTRPLANLGITIVRA